MNSWTFPPLSTIAENQLTKEATKNSISSTGRSMLLKHLSFLPNHKNHIKHMGFLLDIQNVKGTPLLKLFIFLGSL